MKLVSAAFLTLLCSAQAFRSKLLRPDTSTDASQQLDVENCTEKTASDESKMHFLSVCFDDITIEHVQRVPNRFNAGLAKSSCSISNPRSVGALEIGRDPKMSKIFRHKILKVKRLYFQYKPDVRHFKRTLRWWKRLGLQRSAEQLTLNLPDNPPVDAVYQYVKSLSVFLKRTKHLVALDLGNITRFVVNCAGALLKAIPPSVRIKGNFFLNYASSIYDIISLESFAEMFKRYRLDLTISISDEWINELARLIGQTSDQKLQLDSTKIRDTWRTTLCYRSIVNLYIKFEDKGLCVLPLRINPSLKTFRLDIQCRHDSKSCEYQNLFDDTILKISRNYPNLESLSLSCNQNCYYGELKLNNTNTIALSRLPMLTFLSLEHIWVNSDEKVIFKGVKKLHLSTRDDDAFNNISFPRLEKLKVQSDGDVQSTSNEFKALICGEHVKRVSYHHSVTPDNCYVDSVNFILENIKRENIQALKIESLNFRNDENDSPDDDALHLYQSALKKVGLIRGLKVLHIGYFFAEATALGDFIKSLPGSIEYLRLFLYEFSSLEIGNQDKDDIWELMILTSETRLNLRNLEIQLVDGWFQLVSDTSKGFQFSTEDNDTEFIEIRSRPFRRKYGAGSRFRLTDSNDGN